MLFSNTTTTTSRICTFVYLLDYISSASGRDDLYFFSHPKMWNIDDARLKCRCE